ncbi:hypothetical protein C8R45DRAFT_1113215 [Mycena sanguinolenta]|nr:hypothetical protein C8R45DRAFT_1113215 [Mycena sanguinolenta]
MPTSTKPKNAKWTDPETLAMLTTLIEKKSTHQSGNSWKPTVWTDAVSAVQKINQEVTLAKDQTKVVSKLSDPKDIFELYLFVEKFGGTGWDDNKKHATHGKKYAPCFKKPCPFYAELNELYDGLKNRATGEHVIHFPQQCKHKQCVTSKKENPVTAGFTSTVGPTATTSTLSEDINSDSRAPMTVLSNILDDTEEGEGSGGANYDDELSLSPAKPSKKRTHSESNKNNNTNNTITPKGKHRRNKSDSGTGSVRRNGEAGSQLARSVDNLSAAMLKLIMTSKDLSYVDDDDPTLLPADPRGKLFNIVSAALTSSQTRARIFILAADNGRH